MKAEPRVPKKKADYQRTVSKAIITRTNKSFDELPQTAEEIRVLQSEVMGMVGPLLLLANTLISDDPDDGLYVNCDVASKVDFSTISMAAGEALEVFSSKLYVLSSQLERVYSKLDDYCKTKHLEALDNAA
jgi:hypothetical protein